MISVKKYIDKPTGAKMRIHYFNVPFSYYGIMLEKAIIKGISIYENNRQYIEFLGINTKYMKLHGIESHAKDDFVKLTFIFEKLTNNRILK